MMQTRRGDGDSRPGSRKIGSRQIRFFVFSNVFVPGDPAVPKSVGVGSALARMWRGIVKRSVERKTQKPSKEYQVEQ